MVTDENAVSDPKEQAKKESDTPHENQEENQAAPESKPAKEQAKMTEQSEALNDELAKLKDQLKQAEEKASKHWDELLRAKADLENTRKRLERDVENAHKYAVEKFVQDLLPVIDSLEMGVNAAKEMDADIHKVKEGTELTLKMFSDCAGKFGVEAIDPTGQPVNPELHQARTLNRREGSSAGGSDADRRFAPLARPTRGSPRPDHCRREGRRRWRGCSPADGQSPCG